MNNLAPLMSSERDDWNTPECVLELIRELGPIALDPCSNVDSIVHAENFFDLAEGMDGLVEPWSGYGLVFVNPPYGSFMGQWSGKMIREAKEGAEIIALLPSRTDTEWFQHLFCNADAICFWRGRLTFLGAPNPAPFPSAIFYLGNRPWVFAQIFKPHGEMVLL